jgi:hypothetical protein
MSNAIKDLSQTEADENWMPDIHFGYVGAPRVAPISDEDDPDPDDEEMEVSPPSVVAMLGFDPKELNDYKG